MKETDEIGGHVSEYDGPELTGMEVVSTYDKAEDDDGHCAGRALIEVIKHANEHDSANREQPSVLDERPLQVTD